MRKLIERKHVEKIYNDNDYTFRIRAADMLRAARRR
jgi:hypothetical protein